MKKPNKDEEESKAYATLAKVNLGSRLKGLSKRVIEKAYDTEILYKENKFSL